MKNKLINSIISLSHVEVTMTLEQYNAYKEGYISLADIKLINSVDKDLGDIKQKKPDLYKKILLLTALLFMNFQTLAYADALGRINELGNKIYTMIVSGFRWVCIICLVLEIGKSLTKMSSNGPTDIIKSILKYILAFFAIYITPDIFDAIAALCN